MNCHKKSNFFKFHLRKFDGLARCGTKRDSLLRRCRVFLCLKGLDSLWRLGRLIFVKQCCSATLVTV